jgi:hypothetical protein
LQAFVETGQVIIVAIPVVFFKIKDSVPVEEELEGTGETLEDVLPPGIPAHLHIHHRARRRLAKKRKRSRSIQFPSSSYYPL